MGKYDELRGQLKTGDVVLFSGKGLISKGIQWITGSKWSHIGIVLRLDDLDQVVLWESTTLSKTKDLISGKLVSGVQLVSLSRRLASYKGDVAVRTLGGYTWLPEADKVLADVRKEFEGRPYELSKWELVKSAMDLFCHNKEDTSSLFCSELVAEVYQRLHLLSEYKPSNEYTPADFGYDADLKLQIGWLSPEILLKK